MVLRFRQYICHNTQGKFMVVERMWGQTTRQDGYLQVGIKYNNYGRPLLLSARRFIINDDLHIFVFVL